MSEPNNLFQQKGQRTKTGNLTLLTAQIAQWQRLSKIIQPLLPQPEQWQIACYQHGVLILTGENQAMISQLNYLQHHYVQQLTHIEAFKELKKIQVRLRNKPTISHQPTPSTKTLTADTQALLQSAAEYVNDPKLSQALRRLASNKK